MDWFAPPPSKGTSSATTDNTSGVAASGASFAGGSWGTGGSSSGQTIEIIKTNDTTPASNSNVYSALRVHDTYIAKDKDERTSGKLSSDVGFEVGEYVSGASGAILYVDPNTLQTSAELDRLRVRIKAYFETLEIINVNSVGGKQIISPAGSIKCSKVEVKGTKEITKEVQATDDEGNLLYDEDGNPIMETIVESVDNGVPEDTYRCYFVAEQDGEKVENRFQVGDQAYSKKFNAKPGVSSQVSSNYYWRLVTGVGEDYIDLSISDCDTDSDAPQVEDVICHLGSRTNNDRRNALEFSAVDDFSPSVTLYQGIGESDPSKGLYPYSFANKAVVQYGVNKLNNRAFMNVYGDMYIGDRDEKSFLKFDSVGGLTIKGNLSAGTTLGDNDLTLEQRINAAAQAYKEDVNQFKAAVEASFNEVQNQIDGAIETYFLDPVPTLDNEPAVDWVTDDMKAAHVGDLYYNKDGKAYRFQYEKITNDDGSITNKYYWNVITDTDITTALANAQKAQDTADSKRKIFVQQPKTNDSYEVGDMWANASYVDPATERLVYDGDLLRAIIDKEPGKPFSIDHWVLASKYTDDTAANAAAKAAEIAKQAADNAQSDATAAKERLNSWAADNVISPTEKKAVKEEYVRVLSDYDHINEEYEKYFLGDPTNYNNAYTPYITALVSLFNTEQENVPIPSNFETLQSNYYTERTNALNAISTAAKKVADDAQAAADNAQADAERALTVASDAKEVAYDMNFAITGSTEYVRDAFADGIINKGERATIQNQVNQIKTVQAQVEESYKEVESNKLLADSTELVNLKSSYTAFVTAVNELIASITDIASKDSIANIDKAVFENKYNNFNSKYSTYTQWLNACAKYIEYALNTRVDSTIEALGGYSYLKNALNNEKTTVTGGLVLTTMLALGYTDSDQEYHINAGINGAASKNNDIVIWAGGSNIDVFAEPNNPQAADFLVRGDGTGYAAGGNFWWDANGIIHADPMSFVISEQSVGMLLASFQVYYDTNPSTGKTEPYAIDPKVPFTTLKIATDLQLDDSAAIHFGKIKLGYDSINRSIFIKHDDGDPVNFYVTGGISMYGQGDTSVTTFMDILADNIDPNTLKIENGLLTVIGGTGGGGAGATTLGGLSNVGSWADSVATQDRIMYQPANSSQWVAKNLSEISSFSGGVITGSGYNVLVVNRTDRNRPTIGFQYNGSLYGYLGFSNSDYPVFISSVGDAYQLLHANNYSSYALPLSGGTLSNSTASILNINRTGDNYVTPILFSKNGNGLGYIGISKDIEPVFMPSTETTWKVILHEGNCSNYALPLSGGTLTGNNDTPLVLKGDLEDTWIAFRGSDNTFFASIGVKSDRNLYLYTGSTYTVWHSGNFTPSSYLPLTGGTLTAPLKVKTANGPYIEVIRLGALGNVPYIRYSNEEGVIGEIGVAGGTIEKAYPVFWDGRGNTGWHTIWHSNNDGSGSGLDADLLDGKHNGELNAKYLNVLDTRDTNPKPNEVEGRGITAWFNNIHKPVAIDWFSGITVCGWANSYEVWQLSSSSSSYSTDHSNKLFFRKGKGDSWNDWKQIAFTDSNVASATKLQTARTIWGQSFDGTGDISGEFHYDHIWIHRSNEINSFSDINAGTSATLHLQYRTNGNITLCNGGGSVVIGGTVPSYKLHVNGTFGTSSNAYFGGIVELKRSEGSSDAAYIANRSDLGKVIRFGIGTSKNRGIYDNTLGWVFQITSDDKINIGNGNNVGIGTTSPSYKLDVNGSSRMSSLTFTNSDTISLDDCGNIKLASRSGTYWHVDTSSGSNVFVVHSNGNVGIGTTNPQAKLSVAGHAHIGYSSSTLSSAWKDALVVGPDGTDKVVMSYLASSINGAIIGAHNSALNAWSNLYIGGNDIYFFYGGATRMALKSSGDVGIGTSDPTCKLDVNGSVAITGTGSLKMDNKGTMWAKNSSGTYEQWLWPRWSDNATYLNYGSGNFYIRNVNSEHVMTMLNSGNVGIGTTSPAEKLDVKGVVKCSAVYTTRITDLADTWSDGTNNRPWYGYDRKHNTGVYSTTISDYFGMTLRTANVKLVLSQDGNVGIGITNPTRKLDVNGNSRSQYMEFWNTAFNGNAGYIGRGTTANNNIYIHSVGSLLFGVNGVDSKMTLDTSANLTVSGGITMYSDQRKKTILNHVELSLKQIANAPLIEHYYNSDDNKTTHVGSIAQYWAGMNDWFCKLDNEGYYTMEIQNAALASAISIARELDRYETKTDKTIKQLRKRICQLEEEVERLKSA